MSKEVMDLVSEDIMTWGQFFFRNHFTKPSPRFHYQLISQAAKNKHFAVASPRESAKSTYLSFLYPFHRIVFKKEPFIVLISNTFKKAAMYLESIKMEVNDNKLLKEKFPGMSMPRDAEGDTIFGHADGYKTQFLCKGVDQIGSLRGVKFGPHRPGLVILDDVEDDELVRSPERRMQLEAEFDEVLGRVGHEGTQFIIVGTILHDDSQLAKLVDPNKYSKFKKIIFKAHIDADTPKERSLWPDKWSVDDLKELRRLKPNVYAKEMQNDPVAGSNVRFRKDDFRYYSIESRNAILGDAKYSLSECKAGIACDLAWKEKRESDSSVILPGLLTPASDILIMPYINQKGLRPDKLAELLFDMVDHLEKLTGSAVPIGFEKAMLENVSKWFLKREMKARNKFLILKELKWDLDKNQRIETRLLPRYLNHSIFHQHNMGDLEHQLQRFPYGVHDDLIDAEQGLVQVLQFPKLAKQKAVTDDAFMWWREQAIALKTPKKHRIGQFKAKRTFQIPARQSWK